MAEQAGSRTDLPLIEVRPGEPVQRVVGRRIEPTAVIDPRTGHASGSPTGQQQSRE
jgi:hypothetical protein